MSEDLWMWVVGGAAGLIITLAGVIGGLMLRRLGSIDARLEKVDEHLRDQAEFRGGTEARLSDFKRRLDDFDESLKSLQTKHA